MLKLNLPNGQVWASLTCPSAKRIVSGKRATCFKSKDSFIRSYRWHKHSTKKPVTTMPTYPWKCTVLHCNHLGNTWKPLVLMTRHFDYCPSASEGDNQSVRSSALVVSRCFPGGYNVKLYISRGRLAWWLLAFLHSENTSTLNLSSLHCHVIVISLHQCCSHFPLPGTENENRIH